MKDRVKTKMIGVPNEHKKLWKPWSTFQQTVSYFTKLHHCAWGTRYWNEMAIIAQGSSLQYVFDMKWNLYAEIMPVSGHLSIKIRHHVHAYQKVHFASQHVTEIQDSEVNWLFFHKVKVLMYDAYLVWKKIYMLKLNACFRSFVNQNKKPMLMHTKK